MLEIFALIYLCKKIGFLAAQKGVKPGLWKLYTVLAWIVGEFSGVIIGTIIFQETIPAILLGIGLAIGSYFIIKAVLSNKPDVMEDEIDQIGQTVSY